MIYYKNPEKEYNGIIKNYNQQNQFQNPNPNIIRKGNKDRESPKIKKETITEMQY